MRAARHVVDEERLFRRGCVQSVHVVNGIISHVGNEVIVLLADPRKYLGRVSEQIGCPLVGLAPHKSEKLLEAHADRPLVEWSGRAVQIGGGVVVLAKPRRGVSVVAEHGSDCRAVLANDGMLPGEAGGNLAVAPLPTA